MARRVHAFSKTKGIEPLLQPVYPVIQRLVPAPYIRSLGERKMETNPCYTCSFHEGGWQNCTCQVCLEAFHENRCIHDHITHCTFYKNKDQNNQLRAG